MNDPAKLDEYIDSQLKAKEVEKQELARQLRIMTGDRDTWKESHLTIIASM